jgi:hypothetical protein
VQQLPSEATTQLQDLLPDDSQTQDDRLQTQVAERIPDLQVHHQFPSGTYASDASAAALQEPFLAASQDLRNHQDHQQNHHPDCPDIQDEDAGR